VALAVSLFVVGCVKQPSMRTTTVTPPVSTPTGDPRCLSKDRPGLITCEEAIRRANEEGGQGPDRPFDATLEPYRYHRDSKPILAWVVTWHDVQQEVSGGTTYTGPHCLLVDDGVVLDAHSGKFYAEGFVSYSPPTPCPS
jgi:hypothetical protein